MSPKELVVTRTEEERERDLPVIANLYARGWNMHQIAGFMQEKLYPERGTVTIRQVSKDIEQIRQDWMHSALIDFNEARGIEIAKLNTLETAYWQAWEESRSPAEVELQTETDDEVPLRSGEVAPVKRKHHSKQTVTREGNFLYLQGVERCVDKRCKILGLYEPEKFALDWRNAAANLGVRSEDADQIKETTVQILMQAITRQTQTGGKDKVEDVIEGQFTPIQKEREEG